MQAPGRVNLIGEHTDYNDGFVLPCAIDRATVIAFGMRRDRCVRVLACDESDASDVFSLDKPIQPHATQPWANYVRGMVQQLCMAGHNLPGLDLAIAGDVPQGAGLSSSAALEVAVGLAFVVAGGLTDLDATTLARLAQRAENQFVGCQCGVMDQLVSACGQAGHALLIDCRTLQTRAVPLPSGVAVLVAHSMVRRGLVGSEYNARRAACEAAARHFGLPALRDVELADLQPAALQGSSLDATTLRRARHVVSENARTLQAAAALAAGDMALMGRLMSESHNSMRDDFEVTVPAIDRLVQIIDGVLQGEGGCRMTGGGFGGCVVALLPLARVAAVRAAIAQHYRSPDHKAAKVWLCQPSAGAGLIQALKPPTR